MKVRSIPSGHVSMASIVLAASLFLTFTAMAQSTNSPSAAEVQGQTLTSEILSETPATNFTQTGVLRIRNSGGSTNIPVTFETVIGTDRWQVHYAAGKPGMLESLMIVHQNYEPNEYYFLSTNAGTVIDGSMTRLNHDQIMSPFAGSDFSIADLGLEFFHWPDQKVTGHETRRMRDCTKLESDDPNPGGYSRVVTWIDDQTLGIIHAEAYDANGKLLKVFDPKSLKKVNGQWELQDIEIRNVQTRSRTRIQFNLNGKS